MLSETNSCSCLVDFDPKSRKCKAFSQPGAGDIERDVSQEQKQKSPGLIPVAPGDAYGDIDDADREKLAEILLKGQGSDPYITEEIGVVRSVKETEDFSLPGFFWMILIDD